MKHDGLKSILRWLLAASTLVVGLIGAASERDYTNGMGSTYTGDGMISWVDGERWTDWQVERTKREQTIRQYLYETDPDLAAEWGFRQEGYAQTPFLGWKWFEEAPIGFGGVPYVLLKTIIDLDATECANLCALVDIWRPKTAFVGDLVGPEQRTLDHLGFGPHPADYENGVVVSPAERKWPLPYGFVFQSGNPKYEQDGGPFFESIDTLEDSTYQGVGFFEWWESLRIGWKSSPESKIEYLRDVLELKQRAPKSTLLLAKVAETLSTQGVLMAKDGERSGADYADIYEDDYDAFGKSTGLDRVFFSCAACHVGRVLVEASGARSRMVHLPGSPNTEAEAQYYSNLLMRTGDVLVEGGLGLDSTEFIDPDAIVPDRDAITGLYLAMIDKVLKAPESFYGDSETQRLRAHFMVWRVAWNFPQVIKDVIATAVKTHFVYYGVAARYSYNANRQLEAGRISNKNQMPDVMNNRIGQMDAFGIASGLAAIHTLRPDKSFIQFMYRDVDAEGTGVLGEHPGDSPIFTGFADMTGELAEDLSGLEYDQQIQRAGQRVLENLAQWVPPVAAPVDIKSLNFSRDRVYANWDGNQGAQARTLASGTSATGDPTKVNVEIHEPLNPFINNLPPMPYQWDVDAVRAERGRALFFDETQVDGEKQHCSGCHKQHNDVIFRAKTLEVDPWRSRTNTSVSRIMLAAMVLEACEIYRNNNPDKPGRDYCLPDGDTQEEKLADYFADVPARVAAERNGYKADMLHGIWTRAPYLHNGSVPTLGALICPDVRPERFKRGIVTYDTELVGFEWAEAPTTRYNSRYETIQFKEYDTRQLSRSNTGHEYGSHLCPDLTGLDPVADRAEVAKRVLDSDVGDLLEYLKTL